MRTGATQPESSRLFHTVKNSLDEYSPTIHFQYTNRLFLNNLPFGNNPALTQTSPPIQDHSDPPQAGKPGI
jgi:hypothetical protein